MTVADPSGYDMRPITQTVHKGSPAFQYSFETRDRDKTEAQPSKVEVDQTTIGDSALLFPSETR